MHGLIYVWFQDQIAYILRNRNTSASHHRGFYKRKGCKNRLGNVVDHSASYYSLECATTEEDMTHFCLKAGSPCCVKHVIMEVGSSQMGRGQQFSIAMQYSSKSLSIFSAYVPIIRFLAAHFDLTILRGVTFACCLGQGMQYLYCRGAPPTRFN